MKRRSLFIAVIISILFLHVSVSDAQETNTLPNGAKYIGEWKDGKPNGHGTLTYQDSFTWCSHVGEFRNGKPNGQGSESYRNGDKYIGEFKDGKRNGQGTYTCQDGTTYVGEWKDDEANGQGTLTWPEGLKFVGQFKAYGPTSGHWTRIARSASGSEPIIRQWYGLGACLSCSTLPKEIPRYNTEGTLTTPTGDKYWNLKAIIYNGQGTLTLPNGEEFVGEIKSNSPNGTGTMTYLDGRKYVGQFKGGATDGTGKMTYPDGKVEEGLWTQDKFMGASTSP